MIRQFFRALKKSSSNRAPVRPMLESLESREVPSTVQTVSAVFAQLPDHLKHLEASLPPGHASAFSSNLSIVSNDITTLQSNAANFVSMDRFRIDQTVFSDGIHLVVDGLGALEKNPSAGEQVALLGVKAAIGSAMDFAIASQIPSTGHWHLS